MCDLLVFSACRTAPLITDRKPLPPTGTQCQIHMIIIKLLDSSSKSSLFLRNAWRHGFDSMSLCAQVCAVSTLFSLTVWCNILNLLRYIDMHLLSHNYHYVHLCTLITFQLLL